MLYRVGFKLPNPIEFERNMSISENVGKIDKIRIDDDGFEVYPYGHPRSGQRVPLNESQINQDNRPPKSWAEVAREQNENFDDETKAAMELLRKKGVLSG